MGKQLRCIILGAAGRDFHDFQTFFRDRSEYEVVAFTAAQIPFIEQRSFPRELAGPLYDSDIPIFLESELPDLIRRLAVDMAFFSYSDLSHLEVMHKASIVQSHGAGFAMLGPHLTQLRSSRPVIAVTAVRTGAGKSPISQALARHLTTAGHRVAVLRHPMPYGNLLKQRVVRYASEADLLTHECTIEEREEYEPYVAAGMAVYAGVDYAAILAEAEKASDVILWDGGNNDYPFVQPDLSIVVLDALRAGHEVAYYPGETNFRAADVLVLNKVSNASVEALATLRHNVAAFNPRATVIESDLAIALAEGSAIAGKRVVVVEDGPTLTHGGMAYGAGTIAARAAQAQIVEPRAFAVGSIAEAYSNFPHLSAVVPALGYSEAQRADLENTLRASRAEVIIDASPARLDRLMSLPLPIARVSYCFEQRSGPPLFELVDEALHRWNAKPRE